MPDWTHLVRERLAPLGLNAGAESELTQELAAHLEDLYRELRSGGASEPDAYREALAELNDMHPLRAGVQTAQRVPRYPPVSAGEHRRGNRIEECWRDLRYAVRAMRKSPAFTGFVVLTLALGIGGNTTVFTVVNTLLLNPLPVFDPSRLAAVAVTKTANASESNAVMPMSYGDLRDYQARNHVFLSLAGYTSLHNVTWQTRGESRGLFSELVTGNYFSTLGLSAARGRFFLPEEDGAPGAHAVAVLNYGTWQTRFGGAEDIVGKTLPLNNVVFTVIGVAPPAFIGVNAIVGPDVWVPAAMAEQLLPTAMQRAFTDRGKAIFRGVGRLKPGVTEALANADMATIGAELARDYRETHQGYTATVRPIRDVLFANASGRSTPILFAGIGLLVVVGIVLLIACSNVANLLLARAAVRQQEMAVRLAMGASRARLVRQMLTESVLLGLLSGVLGLVVGYAGLRVLFGALPSAATFVSPKLDSTVLLFSLLVSLATGFLFGVLPAFSASRTSVAAALRDGSRTAGRSPGRVTVASVLLVGQVAFSFLLLVTSALFLRSIQRAYDLDPGFQTTRLAVFITSPGQAGYTESQTRQFYRDARARVATLPDVVSVSWAANMPLWARPVTGLTVEGRRQQSQADSMTSIVNTVDVGYFRTAGVAVVRGREFTALDREASALVAIINQKLANDYWPDGEALGKRIRVPGETAMRQVVGIARTANYSAWAEAPQSCVYIPLEQTHPDAMTLYVRTKGNPEQAVVPVQRELRAVAPRVLVSGIRTGREVIDGGLFQARMGVALLSVFGLLALGLASIGLYGLMAYSVHQRTREIGLRMALGAAHATVLRLILKQGMTLVLVGVLIGFAAALIVGRVLSSMLFGVSGNDPLSVSAAAAVLLTIAFLACYFPARRASRVDPLVALRQE